MGDSAKSTWRGGIVSATRKTLEKVLRGAADRNVRFRELVNLLAALGFEKRTRGDHHIYYRQGLVEIINLQPKGSMAKPYQVKQVRELILKYKLGDAL